MARVTLNQVSKIYPGGVKAVDAIDLEIKDEEFVVLVGPSGCGKSTTLRMVAGLEEISGGTIAIGDRIVNNVPPKDRDIAMVFQNYALYPHMTVYKNMAFGLKLRKFPKPEIDQRVREAAKMLEIEHLLERKPKALSGGQRQRVAVGRAIVRDPACFLFDEPLSNLDAKLRVTTRAQLKQLHQRLRTTTIYVTHDQEEAMTLGDRIVVMKDGIILQADGPLETYQFPKNRYVAGFIGMPPMNFFDGMLEQQGGQVVFREGKLQTAEGYQMPEAQKAKKGEVVSAHRDEEGERLASGRLTMPEGGFTLTLPDTLAARVRTHIGRHVVMGIRPEHFDLASNVEDSPPGSRLDVLVNVVEPLGSDMDVYLSTPHHPYVVARVLARSGLVTGSQSTVVVDLDKAHVFEPGVTGMNLSLAQEPAAVVA